MIVRLVTLLGTGLALVAVGTLLLAWHSRGLRPPYWEHMPSCPDSPNCAASGHASPARRVEPLLFQGETAAALDRLAAVLERQPGLVVVARGQRYLQARAHSPLLGFVDDLFFAVAPNPSSEPGVMHCFSVSRVGWWDLGANKRRLERIRRDFAAETGS